MAENDVVSDPFAEELIAAMSKPFPEGLCNAPAPYTCVGICVFTPHRPGTDHSWEPGARAPRKQAS